MATNGPEGILGLEPHRFACALLIKDDGERNQHRYCCLTWQETQFGEGTRVRAWGRRGTAMRREVPGLDATGEPAALSLRCLLSVDWTECPQGGSNPCCRLERPES